MPTTDNPFRLDGETALITGGGTGIGLGVARRMIAAGAGVVLVGRRADPLRAACAELGPHATFVTADITAPDTAAGIVAAAEAGAGAPITILVNNAGTHLKKFAADTSPAEFRSLFETHVFAAHALTQALLPGMVARGKGAVLFTSSMAAFMGVPQVVAYAAAKSSFFGMVATLSAELAAKGVRVNAIAPGWIFSEMSSKALDNDPARKAKVMGRIHMGRMGTPEDIGNAAVFLCSPAAGYVTGVTLPVDGGSVVGF